MDGVEQKNQSKGQRMLAAILVSDAAGYSALAGMDEQLALQRVDEDFAVMRRIAADYEGRVIKSTGDGLLMLFSSASQAVSCALAIQKALSQIKLEHPNDIHLQHRIGVHLGDVVVTEDDAMGNGVNVAARLQEEAGPGGICISQTVYDVVKQQLSIRPVSLGQRQLKNLPEPIPVYELRFDGATTGATFARKKKQHSGAWTGAAILAVGVLLGASVWAILGKRDNGAVQPRYIVQPAPFDLNALFRANAQYTADSGFMNEMIANSLKEQTKELEKLKAIPEPDSMKPPSTPKVQSPPAESTEKSSEAGAEMLPPDAADNLTGTPLADFGQFRKDALQRYDFQAIVDYLQKRATGPVKGIAELKIRKYKRLGELWSWLESQIGKVDPDEISVEVGVQMSPDAAKAASKGKLNLRTLNPNQLAIIMRALTLKPDIQHSPELPRILTDIRMFETEYDTLPTTKTLKNPASGGARVRN